jgi:hypothetical protein
LGQNWPLASRQGFICLSSRLSSLPTWLGRVCGRRSLLDTMLVLQPVSPSTGRWKIPTRAASPCSKPSSRQSMRNSWPERYSRYTCRIDPRRPTALAALIACQPAHFRSRNSPFAPLTVMAANWCWGETLSAAVAREPLVTVVACNWRVSCPLTAARSTENAPAMHSRVSGCLLGRALL